MSDSDYLLRQIASLTNAVNEQRAALDKCHQTIGGLEWTVQELERRYRELGGTWTTSSIRAGATGIPSVVSAAEAVAS